MTLEDIKKAVQESRFTPSDIFSATQLVSDPFIKDHVEEKINNAKGYDIRKRQELETKVATLETEKTALQGELASSKSSVIKTKARETFDAILKERPKLAADPKLVKFVDKAFNKGFAPKEGADLKAELNKFIDDQVVEFTEIFGDGKAGGNGKDKTEAEKAAEAAAAAAEETRDKTNLLDPKNNDLIPA